MPSIKDVAKAAGVSVSTVSNILNNKTSVSEELHERVIKVMEAMDYHPNFLAMNLKRKRISFIGVIVSSMTGHVSQIFDGINRICKAQKCQPILKIVDNTKEEHREIEELIQLSVSGILVISANLNPELIRHYNETGLPIVYVDFHPVNSDCSIVCFDNRQIVFDLTNKLMRRGKTVGLITCSRQLGSEEDCVRGYLDALDQSVQSAPVLFETEFSKERAFSGLIDFICRIPKLPDCLIVSADHLAETVAEICSLLCIENTSIYALSGDSWFKHRGNSISYLRRDAIQCGIQAAKVLIENIANPATFDTIQITVESHGEVQKLFEVNPLTEPPKSSGKTLKLLLLKSNISNAIEKLSRDFTEKTGIRITVTEATQQELAQMILDNAAAHRSEYDVIMADMHWLQQIKHEGAFCRLNELLPVDQILPRYIRDVRSYILSEAEGEDLFALPILAGYQMLAYRSDLFEDALLKKRFYLKYGVQLQPPHTWSEFNLVAKFFTRAFHKDSPVTYGTCLTGSKPEGIMAEFLPRQWSFHGKLFGNRGLEIDSVSNLKAVKSLCESYLYSYPDCMDFLEDEQVQEFARGDVAMISTYNVHLHDMLNASEQNIRFARLPGTSALIGGWLLGINSYSTQIEESALFLRWEMSDQISVHSSLLGQISPFKNVFYDNELRTIYPWMSIIDEHAVSLRGKESGSASLQGDRDGRKLEQMLANNLWRVLRKELSPEEMLNQMQAKLEGIYSGN